MYRVIDIDAVTARRRAVIGEERKTFFCYSGKKFRYDVDDGTEIVWMSERDGWNHLYLGTTGYPCYDISRVGPYGTSAGGQSALGAFSQ